MTRFTYKVFKYRGANKKHSKKMAGGIFLIGSPCDRQNFQICQLCVALFLSVAQSKQNARISKKRLFDMPHQSFVEACCCRDSDVTN